MYTHYAMQYILKTFRAMFVGKVLVLAGVPQITLIKKSYNHCIFSTGIST